MGLLKDFMTYVNKYLVSENGQKFKFAFDEATQKYGYIVTDSAGADTFHPFREEEEAEPEPLEHYLFQPNNACTSLTGGYGGYAYYPSGQATSTVAPTITVGETLKAEIIASDYNAKTGVMITEKAIDFTNFETLNMVYDYHVSADTDIGDCYLEIYLLTDKTNEFSGTCIASYDIMNPNGTNYKLEYDISGLSGMYYVAFAIRARGTGFSTYIDIKEMYLKVIEEQEPIKYKSLIGANFTPNQSNNAVVEECESTERGHVLLKGSNPDSALAVVYYESDYFDLADFRYLKMSGVCTTPWYAYVKIQKEGDIGTTTLLELSKVSGATFNKCVDLKNHSGKNRISLQIQIKNSSDISSLELFELTLITEGVEMYTIVNDQLLINRAYSIKTTSEAAYIDCEPDWIEPEQNGDVLTIEQVYSATQNNDIVGVE